MLRLSIDNHTSMFDAGHKKKIGEIVEMVVSAIPRSRVITQIIVDGKQLSRFQNPDLMDSTSDSIAELSVCTSEREILASNGIDMALACLEPIKRSLISTAEFFRDNQTEQAEQVFSRCIDGLDRFIEILSLNQDVAEINFKQITIDNVSLADLETNLKNAFKKVIFYHRIEQFPELADKIEYELLTNLSTWTRALKQLRRSQNGA